MQRIKIEQKSRRMKLAEGVVNQSELYLDKDNYTIYNGEINQNDWHMMLIQMVAKGYKPSEAYTEIRKHGMAPKGDNTMYNFFSDFKIETGLKFRVDD